MYRMDNSYCIVSHQVAPVHRLELSV